MAKHETKNITDIFKVPKTWKPGDKMYYLYSVHQVMKGYDGHAAARKNVEWLRDRGYLAVARHWNSMAAVYFRQKAGGPPLPPGYGRRNLTFS
jgi:hypothetical protein